MWHQGSSANLSDSEPLLPDEGSTVDTEAPKITVQDNKAPVDHDSIKAAKNLARVFSLEDRLKQEVEFSQDEFSSKIPQFLLEVSEALYI